MSYFLFFLEKKGKICIVKSVFYSLKEIIWEGGIVLQQKKLREMQINQEFIVLWERRFKLQQKMEQILK